MSAQVAIAIAGLIVAAVTLIGGAIAAYTVLAVRGATTGVVEAVRGLAKSVDLLRAELTALREQHNEVARIVAVLQDAHENGGK